MNSDIERLYQDIGRAACDVASGMNGNLLVYAEVEDGVISGSLFYEKGADRSIVFKFCPRGLQDLIYSLWQRWSSFPGNSEWRALEYFIQDGRFAVKLIYPEQINPDEGMPERRPKVIEKYFGNAKVDYSNPSS